MTVLSDAPGRVAQRFPAGSVEGWRFSGASLARSHSRASRQTGPQATRCAPSGVEVRAASSRRSAMTRFEFSVAGSGICGVGCDEAMRESPKLKTEDTSNGQGICRFSFSRRILRDEGKVFADGEATDTFVGRRAVAVGKAAHEFFEATGADNDLAHFDNFSRGEFFPSWTDGGGLANAAEKGFDFGEREPHFAGKTDK